MNCLPRFVTALMLVLPAGFAACTGGNGTAGEYS